MAPRDPDVRVIKESRCPRCSGELCRFEHSPGWVPPQEPGRYWFRWWDRCRDCGYCKYGEGSRVTVSA